MRGRMVVDQREGWSQQTMEDLRDHSKDFELELKGEGKPRRVSEMRKK